MKRACLEGSRSLSTVRLCPFGIYTTKRSRRKLRVSCPDNPANSDPFRQGRFSCDIAYSRSPAASRAAARSLSRYWVSPGGVGSGKCEKACARGDP